MTYRGDQLPLLIKPPSAQLAMSLRSYFHVTSNSKSRETATSSHESAKNYDSLLDLNLVVPRNTAQNLFFTSVPNKEIGGIMKSGTSFTWLEFDEDLQGAFCELC